MKLTLYRTIGYEADGFTPIPGASIQSFTGNKNQCTNVAKKWIQKNPSLVGVVNPIWKWSNT